MNKQIFEIINRLFPGEFKLSLGETYIVNNCTDESLNLLSSIEDNLFIAEKTNLLNSRYIGKITGEDYALVTEAVYEGVHILYRDKTIIGLIHKAIIDIYGDSK